MTFVDEELPLFKLVNVGHGCQGPRPCPRLADDIPEIDIVFPNGHEDSLVLQRYYSSPEARMAGEKHCNFFGHLKFLKYSFKF